MFIKKTKKKKNYFNFHINQYTDLYVPVFDEVN